MKERENRVYHKHLELFIGLYFLFFFVLTTMDNWELILLMKMLKVDFKKKKAICWFIKPFILNQPET